MSCPHCQIDSPEGATACVRCGRALPRPCPRCGFGNPPGFKFCGQCAAPLAVEAPPPSAPPADGERRRVTVLFCDLVGAAQLSERLDPEEMHGLVRAYQAAAEVVIERHGGHVAQYLGDGLLVYFGYPVEREGSARSAALAALEIVEAVEGLAATLGAERGVDVAARIGMHSGEGVAGDVGGRLKREQLVVGRAPNIAARLRELASPGTVIASGATAELVEDDVELLSLGERTLKGIAEPIGVFRVLWRRQGPISAPMDVVREAPLAGDHGPLDALVAAARDARAGRGRVVLVRGADGSGKTRLVRELAARFAASPSPPDGPALRFEVARCRAKTRSTPLTPFLDALEKIAGRDAIAAALQSGALTCEARGERTRIALADLVVDLARSRPLALVVEDLELADPSSLALFAELAARAPSAPLLLFGTCAPPAAPELPAEGVTRLELGPLDGAGARELLRAIAGDQRISPDVEERILASAGGLPLLIQELGRAVVRSLSRGGDAALDLRSAVHATLATVGPAREAAWMASVLGPRFELDALRVVCAFDPSTLSRFLERLTTAGILAAEEDGELSFSHALVRDAIYDAISPVRRRDAHAKAALALAASEGRGSRGAIVAWHLVRAGLAEEASRALSQAAAAALQEGAGVEALAMLSGALDLVTSSVDGARRTRLEIELRTARARTMLAWRGPSAAGLGRELSRARELGRRADAPIEMLHLVRAQWALACWNGNGPAALSLDGELSALAARAPGERGAGASDRPPAPGAGASRSEYELWRACAAKVAGTTAFYRGRLEEALMALRSVTEGPCSADPAASMASLGDTLCAGAFGLRGWIEALMGGRAASLGSLARAARVARSCGDAAGEVDAAVLEVLARRDLGETAATLEAGRAALELASRQHMPVSAAIARCGMGWALGRAGDPSGGVAEIERAVEVVRAHGRKIELPLWGVLLAETCLAAGQLDAAERALDEAMTLSVTQLDAVFKPEVLRLSGELASRRGDLERACAHHQRAAETARTYGALVWALAASSAHARALAALGRRDEALAALEAALRGAEGAADTAHHRAASALRDELTRRVEPSIPGA